VRKLVDERRRKGVNGSTQDSNLQGTLPAHLVSFNNEG
jgi:hypothetical protein